MKIGVIGATPADTQMGVNIIQSSGFNVSHRTVASDPDEIVTIYNTQPDTLQQRYERFVEEVMTEGAEKIFIYSNSLSAMVDYQIVARTLHIPTVTPLEAYQALPDIYQNVLNLCATGASASDIEHYTCLNQPKRRVISLSHLPLVEAIEEARDPIDIIYAFRLDKFFEYANSLTGSKDAFDVILLGCTHFPYLRDALERLTDIPLFDPATYMLEALATK